MRGETDSDTPTRLGDTCKNGNGASGRGWRVGVGLGGLLASIALLGNRLWSLLGSRLTFIEY